MKIYEANGWIGEGVVEGRNWKALQRGMVLGWCGALDFFAKKSSQRKGLFFKHLEQDAIKEESKLLILGVCLCVYDCVWLDGLSWWISLSKATRVAASEGKSFGSMLPKNPSKVPASIGSACWCGEPDTLDLIDLLIQRFCIQIWSVVTW